MSRIDLVDLEDIEQRLAFVMHELRLIRDLTHVIVRAAKPSGLEESTVRWTEGRFSAFVQQAGDAVWAARCTVGLVPDNKDEQGKDEDEQ